MDQKLANWPTPPTAPRLWQYGGTYVRPHCSVSTSSRLCPFLTTISTSIRCNFQILRPGASVRNTSGVDLDCVWFAYYPNFFQKCDGGVRADSEESSSGDLRVLRLVWFENQFLICFVAVCHVNPSWYDLRKRHWFISFLYVVCIKMLRTSHLSFLNEKDMIFDQSFREKRNIISLYSADSTFLKTIFSKSVTFFRIEFSDNYVLHYCSSNHSGCWSFFGFSRPWTSWGERKIRPNAVVAL